MAWLGRRRKLVPEQFCKSDRSEVPGIHADVMLAEHGFQLAVAVAMQVDRAAVLAIPAPERIMAEDQAMVALRHFGVVADASPALHLAGRNGIIVAPDQVLGAV